VDVNGALSIKRKYRDEAVSIFIKPPSLESLEERLRKRNTETDESIAKRLRKANMENTYARKFDHIVVNENLDDAIEETAGIAGEFLG
ncbi:MAG: guanylate kinase, partial [Bacteroidales bacterium]